MDKKFLNKFFPTEYFLMCEKAIEIQEKWEPQIGDFAKHPRGKWADTFGCVVSAVSLPGMGLDKISFYRGKATQSGREYNYVNVEEFQKSECVWFPRQDQLIIMIATEVENGRGGLVLASLTSWANKIKPNQSIRLSYVTYLLQNVMKLLHNKKWDQNKLNWIEVTQ